MPNEADTCRRYVVPRLQAAGWEDEPHRINEQVTFTDGRIVVAGRRTRRRRGKRADYILRYRPDLAIAVVEAKPDYATPGAGLQQAKEYAEILGLKFAYGTNGHGIVEFDFLTGLERELDTFPTPAELWSRLSAGEALTPEAAERLLAPAYHLSGKSPRYYQEIAINRAVQGVALGNRRTLLTMATGTGKTVVAFQICWKLWSTRWNRTGEFRRPRILYLADRNFLVDVPMAETFAPFGDARWKIENGRAVKSREMYFAILPGHCPRRAPARLVSRIRPGLLRPHHRGRVPPRQRPRRQQLAGNPRIFRTGLPDWHDCHASSPGQRRHLQLLR
jgi:type I restriction enzyme R subunit